MEKCTKKNKKEITGKENDTNQMRERKEVTERERGGKPERENWTREQEK